MDDGCRVRRVLRVVVMASGWDWLGWSKLCAEESGYKGEGLIGNCKLKNNIAARLDCSCSIVEMRLELGDGVRRTWKEIFLAVPCGVP